uniref:Uncharacterized protein n=1 Tax=Micrurus corallinus TaxID=54390 RepID=A0A2D4FPM0_MICCO
MSPPHPLQLKELSIFLSFYLHPGFFFSCNNAIAKLGSAMFSCGKTTHLGINRTHVFEVFICCKDGRFVRSFICQLRRIDLAFKFITLPSSSLNISLAWFS